MEQRHINEQLNDLTPAFPDFFNSLRARRPCNQPTYHSPECRLPVPL